MNKTVKWAIRLGITLIATIAGAAWRIAHEISQVRIDVAAEMVDLRVDIAVLEKWVADLEYDLLLSGRNDLLPRPGTMERERTEP